MFPHGKYETQYWKDSMIIFIYALKGEKVILYI